MLEPLHPERGDPEGLDPVYIVEGPIKALALIDRGFNALGLGGTSTTLMEKGGVRRPNGSWAKVTLRGRCVVLVFDSNRSTNPNVARDEARLAVALEQSGASVTLAMLSPREDGEHQGPDDFLATYGPAKFAQVVGAAVPADPIKRVESIVARLAGEERKKTVTDLLADLPFLAALKERGQVAQMHVVDILKPFGLKSSMLGRALKDMAALLKAKNTSLETVSTSSKYLVHEGQFCKPSRIGDAGSPEPICNFTARIVEQEIVDDGADKTRHFVIEGTLASGALLPRVRVTPQEFAGELWPSEKWGAKSIIYADISRAAGHLRAAIQTISDPVDTVTYMHSGFREHGGKWIYLHAGGAVGAPEVVVDLESSFRRYKLPAFAEEPAEAVKLSLGLLATADKRITLPLHCAVYRAPLQEFFYCDTVLALHGRSGSMKSSLAAIAQSHWGDFDHMTLPLSWGATPKSRSTTRGRRSPFLRPRGTRTPAKSGASTSFPATVTRPMRMSPRTIEAWL